MRLNSSEADHWGHHAWLDHCPIVADQLSLTDLSDPNAAPVALNLWDPQPGMDAAQTLLALATLERVWDPCKQRVQLLRRLGIRASWLRPNAIGNGYLLSQQIDSTLGLPEPQALQSIGCSVLCLGYINPTFEQSLEPPPVWHPQLRCPHSWHQHTRLRSGASLPGGKAIDRAFSGLTL